MGINSWVSDNSGKNVAEIQRSAKPNGFDNVKNIIADKLHNAAEAISEKAADGNALAGLGECGKYASGWLDQSAEYVREFDIEQADVKVREYVGESPGRSLLIAGAVGLVVGVLLRRR